MSDVHVFVTTPQPQQPLHFWGLIDKPGNAPGKMVFGEIGKVSAATLKAKPTGHARPPFVYLGHFPEGDLDRFLSTASALMAGQADPVDLGRAPPKWGGVNAALAVLARRYREASRRRATR